MIGLAKVARGPGNLALVERPSPMPGAGQAVVQVVASGVCGTDLHIEADEYPNTPPVILGHEVCGRVASVGPEVDAAWVGALVVMETYADACESCRYCQSGRRNLCANRRSIGVHVDGGFATELLIPVRNLHKVPPGIEPYAAALAEPLACVCNCLFDPSVVNGGDEVLVTGPGPVGLLAAQCARAAGGHVTVVGLHSDEARLKVASDLGFATSFQGDPSTFDVVIECSGSASGAALCLDAVVPGGRYVQVGVFGRSVEIPLDHMFRKELLMTSGCASTPASWRRALQIIPSGEIELSLLVTDVVPLQSWEAAFSRFKTGVGLKTLIDPRLS